MGATILIVEDEPDMRDVVGVILRSAGHSVISAGNGSAGIEMATEYLPDVVLLDIMLPDIDGWEVLSTLKGQERTQGIPVIIAAALSHSVHKMMGMKAGGHQDMITKPFTIEELLSKIDKVLKGTESDGKEVND